MKVVKGRREGQVKRQGQEEKQMVNIQRKEKTFKTSYVLKIK